MLYKLLNLQNYFLIYTIITVILSAIITFFVSYPLLSFLKKKKMGQFIRELGPKAHFKKAGTPTMGAIIFIIPSLLCSFLLVPLNSLYVWISITGFLLFSYIGFQDDYLKLIKQHNDGLSAFHKLLLQTIFSFIISILIFYNTDSSIYIPFISYKLHLSYFFIPFSTFVIVSWANAVNLTDGLDGLATNLSIIFLTTVLVIIFIHSPNSTNQSSVGTSDKDSWIGFFHSISNINITGIFIFILIVTISLIIFRRLNIFPALVFMGDTGSLGLGALIAIISLLLHIEILSLLLGSVFIIETLSVIIQVAVFKKTKKRVFRMAPLHHHFELVGFTEPNIVNMFSTIAIICSIITVLLSKFFN